MEVLRLVMGAFETNTYLLKENGKCLVVDPAGKADKIIAKIGEDEVVGILLTHGHFDHIKAVDPLYKLYHCPIYLSPEDFDLVDPKNAKLFNCYMNLTASISSPVSALEEKIYQIGPFEFEVMATPGHTKGSVIFVFEDCIFSGDTLFKESVGRTDLYGGSESDLKQSLKIFKTFNKDYIIYPGHDEISSLSYELQNNHYLR